MLRPPFPPFNGENTMKTVIFVDGENLRYGLQEMDLQEKNVDWTRFFRECLDDGDDLIRAY